MKKILYVALGVVFLVATFAVGSEIRQVGKEDVNLTQTDGGAVETWTSAGGVSVTKINGNDIPWSNEYTRTIRPGDIVTKGPWPDVRAYGAVGDGVADDTAELQSSINSAISSNVGGKVLMPAGTFNISSTITIDSVNGLILTGSGGRTILSWSGDNTSPMFLLSDCQHCTLENFDITVPSGKLLNIGIELENGSGGAVAPVGNTLRNITIQGVDSTRLNYGTYHDQGAGGDNNNDSTSFYNVIVYNYAEAAHRIEHAQSKGHNFYGCQYYGYAVGKYGVYADSGSFTWHGGIGSGASLFDFYLGTPQSQILIEGAVFESSANFINLAGPTSAPWPVTVIGNTWTSQNTASGNGFIQINSPGPLVLIGNNFSSSHATYYPKVYFNAVGGLGFVSEGNSWIWTGGEILDSNIYFPAASGSHDGVNVRVSGDVYTTSAGAVANKTIFTDADTTPSIMGGDTFYTANTNPTTITNFENGFIGKTFTLVAGDNNTTLQHGTIKLRGGSDIVMTTGSTVQFIWSKYGTIYQLGYESIQ